MKPVVLFYSFSGSTRRVADFLARFAELCPGADVKPGFQVQRVRRLSDEEIEKAIEQTPL